MDQDLHAAAKDVCAGLEATGYQALEVLLNKGFCRWRNIRGTMVKSFARVAIVLRTSLMKYSRPHDVSISIDYTSN